MKLSRTQRINELKKAETGKDYFDLYEKIFGQEYPETVTRDPNEDIENIVQAIYDNIPVQKVELPNDAKI